MVEIEKEVLRPGDRLKLACVGLGKKGDGVFKHETGLVIIVPNATVGKTYMLEVAKVFTNFALAEILEEV